MPSSQTCPASFSCENGRALKARGVAGARVNVCLEGDTLVIRGEDGARVTIVAGSVDRIRQFHSPSGAANSGFHETRIWWEGGRTPVVISGCRGYGYRPVIVGLAAQVAALRGAERLEIGPDTTFAIINGLIVLVPFIGFGGALLWSAVADGGWWLVGVMIVLAGLGWLIFRHLLPRWPRRAGSLDRFAARLPEE